MAYLLAAVASAVTDQVPARSGAFDPYKTTSMFWAAAQLLIINTAPAMDTAARNALFLQTNMTPP
jgi:hypothetical protein